MNEINWQLFWILMILHCLIGIAAAFVAKSRVLHSIPQDELNPNN